MSGGSYDYSFHRVNDMADELERSGDIIRRAFAAHLRLVAKAIHDVEWGYVPPTLPATGGKVDKTAYAVQLARYATSTPYDVDTDTRGTW